MASEFIGYNVLVTLKAPPHARLQGEVADVVGQRLILRNVTLLWSGQRLAAYNVEGPDIADLSLETASKPSVQIPQHPIPQGSSQIATPVVATQPVPSQPFVDPAILSFSKASVPQPSQPLPSKVASAVLTEPFSDLELNVEGRTTGLSGTSSRNGLEGLGGTDNGAKGTGRRDPKTGHNELHDAGAVASGHAASNTNPKAKGWRQTAFVEPAHPQTREHTQSYKGGATSNSNGRRQKKKKSRAGYSEDVSGWATEDATDIQEMGDFDFESNLSKFDKRRVFEEIRNDDTTADEARLVYFNRRAKPGTNGGKNLHWSENVLDSPRNSDVVESDEEPSDAKLSSGNHSGFDPATKIASRPQGSRKGSGILGQPLMAPQLRSQLSTSRTTSPRGHKQSVSASPMNGPTTNSGASLRLTTTNRSCPTVSPLQTLEVEQLAVTELGLTEDIITENAGRGIAEAAVAMLSNDAAAPTILLLAGNHRTGARAVAAARHLRNRGHRVTVCMLGLEHESDLLDSCRKQLDIFKKIGGRALRWEELSARLSTSEFSPDLVVDALLAMHIAFDDLRTEDQAIAFEMTAWVNRSNLEVLSVDVPSGVSATSGEVTVVEGSRLCIAAKSVVCLGAPKTGVINALVAGEGLSWKITVADIGIPQVVWRKYGTRRRHGVDFGNRWVVPLRFQAPAITHSEWASEDAYSASAGAGVSRARQGTTHASFKRLPFNFCALSLQPFTHPVCTPSGTIFDLLNILPWIKKHGTNPVDGTVLKSGDLIKLKLAKNEAGEYVDPVTYKVFTDNTHIVALRNTGNVFAWDTVERLNIKGKIWRDLVTDEEFSRKDIIVLQDPQNVESRNLSSFTYLKEGQSGLTAEQAQERSDTVNVNALGSSAKILKAKEAVAKARAERAQQASSMTGKGALTGPGSVKSAAQKTSLTSRSEKPTPFNAARHTTGLAAASFTSTGMTPHTSADLALLSDEEYMLKRGRVKGKGYARISTTAGDLNLELYPEYAPKAVWNFLQLAKKGYYKDVTFHRNIKGFMIQGGDPTGTGRGGESVWGKYFADEFEGPLKHDARGTLSMANKGKNTNSSQFFIAYRALPHLNNKHTIFGRLIDDPTPSSTTLNTLETHPVDSTTNKPTPDIRIKDVAVFVDPFEEFLAKKREQEQAEKAHDEENDGEESHTRRADDDRVTWTGKRVRGRGAAADHDGDGSGGGVGKYLKAALAERSAPDDEIVEFVDEEPAPALEPARKKMRGTGGFGDFSSW
ncbi:hypothetical protein ASPZODRAFT_148429 [Penicilliopsis zonata CBS 506.65]|uniref:Enhancer of mRNA-decapping protein 3 n=1 Tax=Penicilliopsis zonata CBS 506.65 TaxID=1073090 RepID=A0A1L9SVG2_9EURO|nr:hypothetical protein ASPZODRAFT_148429 [Penicilliopsis zonata CBS 506.65]OJJ51067.1 hypothetical protein ASPZODRAFT_148429 [Penicilliopsis zonata CBS 506.65]